MPAAPGSATSPAGTVTTPTGAQWSIGHGRQHAVVTEVGATLREYVVDDVAVIDGFGPHEMSPSGRGQVLAPWPNRLGDGRYEFAGVPAQAALNEIERRNAIHGLVRWRPFALDGRAQNRVQATCWLHATPDYPFDLALDLDYHLGRDGLTVVATARNIGDHPLPFGLGFHPYLSAGAPRIDTGMLRLPATETLVMDDRALPTGEVRRVEGTEYDFTRPRPIGTSRMDTAFTGLVRDADGIATAHLEDPASGRAVELWVDEAFGYLMCFTGDAIEDVGRRRAGLALEPMTCPPDAFRSGRSVIALQPGQSWTGSWGLRVR
jgi:aldose 1-epimerase